MSGFVARNTLPRLHLSHRFHLAGQPLAGFVNRARVSDQGDDVIKRIDGLRQTFQNVSASAGLAEIVFRSPPNYFAAKIDEALQHLFNSERAAVR